MGATAITGVSGPGDSHGKHKCENQCGGCGCGCGEPTPAPTVRKRGCYTKSVSGGSVSVKAGGTTGVKVC
jgi:hypothetical protein